MQSAHQVVVVVGVVVVVVVVVVVGVVVGVVVAVGVVNPIHGTHSLANLSRNPLIHSQSKPPHLRAASMSFVAHLIRQSMHPEERGKHIFFAAILENPVFILPETSSVFPAVGSTTMRVDRTVKERKTYPMMADISVQLFSCLLVSVGHQSSVKYTLPM